MKEESKILAELCPRTGEGLVLPEIPGHVLDISFVNARDCLARGYLPEGRVEILLTGETGPLKPLKGTRVWRRHGALIFLLTEGQPAPI